MVRVLVIHLQPPEAGGIADRIRRAGFDVQVCPLRGQAALPVIRENPPDVFVIDLMRMPSYGRWMGTWLRENKATRMIPLVFIEGDPEKTRAVRKLLPDAGFTKLPQIGAALEKALKNPPKDPMRGDPTRIPAAGKLRIREGSTVALLNAPKGFRQKLEPLPAGVRFRVDAAEADVILLFAKSAGMLSRELPMLVREVRPKRMVWVLWPKKTSGLMSDLTIPTMGEMFAVVGLTGHKICAVDETWSALAVARSRGAAHAFSPGE